jgi:two-component system, NarL family, sensor kinase
LKRGSEAGFVPPQASTPGDSGSGADRKVWRPAPLAAGSMEPGVNPAASFRTTASQRDLSTLMDLQSRFLQRYFRLQQVERQLLRRARRRRPGPGRRAIEQIELERQRLGRDLHTGLGQMLAATRVQLEIIDSQMPTPPAVVRQALDRIAALASQALDQVRAVSRRLHPPEWQRLSLVQAIRQLWELSGLPQRTQASLSIPPDLPDPDLDAKILIYRAVQEAISNIIRHSHATSVALSLEMRNTRLTLTVRDNGVGFDPAALLSGPANLGGGIGLRAIREQAAAIGAEFAVRSGPDGSTLEVSVPGQKSPAASP